jgi:hypothetical protein
MANPGRGTTTSLQATSAPFPAVRARVRLSRSPGTASGFRGGSHRQPPGSDSVRKRDESKGAEVRPDPASSHRQDEYRRGARGGRPPSSFRRNVSGRWRVARRTCGGPPRWCPTRVGRSSDDDDYGRCFRAALRPASAIPNRSRDDPGSGTLLAISNAVTSAWAPRPRVRSPNARRFWYSGASHSAS